MRLFLYRCRHDPRLVGCRNPQKKRSVAAVTAPVSSPISQSAKAADQRMAVLEFDRLHTCYPGVMLGTP